MATHSSILAWKMSQTEEPGIRKSWTQLSTHTHTHTHTHCINIVSLIMTNVPQ